MFLLLSLPGLFLPVGRDEGNFLLIGNELLRGALPYREVWDNKPPGIFLIYAAIAALDRSVETQALLVKAASLLALLAAFVALAWAAQGDRAAAILRLMVAALLLPLGMSYWLAGQAEVFALPLSTLGFLILKRYLTTRSRPAAFLTGFVFGLLPLLKPQFLLVGLLPLLTVGLRHPRGALLILGSLCLPGAVAVIALAGLGVGADARTAVFEFNLAYSAHPLSLPGFLRVLGPVLPLHALVLGLGLLLALALGLRLRRDPPGLALILWLLGSVAAVAVAGRYWLYHWLIVLPPATLFAGLIYQEFRLRPNWSKYGLPVALLILLLATPAGIAPLKDWLAWQNAGEVSLVSPFVEDYVNHYSQTELLLLAAKLQPPLDPDDRVVYFGYDGIFYLYSGHRPASRFFYDFPLTAFDATNPLGRQFRDQFLTDVGRHPPRMVVIPLNDTNPVERMGSAEQLARLPELKVWLQTHYDVHTTFSDYRVYVRKE